MFPYRYRASVGNYYGTPQVWTEDNEYFIGIEDYSGRIQEKISKEFFDAWVKEFGKNFDH